MIREKGGRDVGGSLMAGGVEFLLKINQIRIHRPVPPEFVRIILHRVLSTAMECFTMLFAAQPRSPWKRYARIRQSAFNPRCGIGASHPIGKPE